MKNLSSGLDNPETSIDGEYNTDHTYIQRPSKKNCKYCEFNQTEHCDVGVK